MYWDKDEPLLFHVVEKATGNIFPVKYEADPMGFFHMINAYEEDNFLILDAPFKSSPVSYNVFQVKPLSGIALSISLDRYCIAHQFCPGGNPPGTPQEV